MYIRIMVAALSFLLGYENVEEEDTSDASSSDDEEIEKPVVLLSKEDVYKVLSLSLSLVGIETKLFAFPFLESSIM